MLHDLLLQKKDGSFNENNSSKLLLRDPQQGTQRSLILYVAQHTHLCLKSPFSSSDR